MVGPKTKKENKKLKQLDLQRRGMGKFKMTQDEKIDSIQSELKKKDK